MSSHEKEHKDDVFTVPNALSLLRIVMIPIYMFLYFNGRYPESLVVVAASALTDILDGFIARKFHMVSTLGKVLDPIADKLSQLTLMLCLVTRFPHMLYPILLIVVKELTSGILGLVTLKKTGLVEGADWHGKVTTVLLYAMMMLHIIWYSIPALVSDITIGICLVMMAVSFVLYVLRYARMLRAGRAEKEKKLSEETAEAPDSRA